MNTQSSKMISCAYLWQAAINKQKSILLLFTRMSMQPSKVYIVDHLRDRVSLPGCQYIIIELPYGKLFFLLLWEFPTEILNGKTSLKVIKYCVVFVSIFLFFFREKKIQKRFYSISFSDEIWNRRKINWNIIFFLHSILIIEVMRYKINWRFPLTQSERSTNAMKSNLKDCVKGLKKVLQVSLMGRLVYATHNSWQLVNFSFVRLHRLLSLMFSYILH